MNSSIFLSNCFACEPVGLGVFCFCCCKVAITVRLMLELCVYCLMLSDSLSSKQSRAVFGCCFCFICQFLAVGVFFRNVDIC